MKDEVIFVDKICKCSVASEAVMEADAVPLEVAPTSEMAPVLLAEIQSRNRERWELTDETPLGQPKVLDSERKASEASFFLSARFFKHTLFNARVLALFFFKRKHFECTLIRAHAFWVHTFMSARFFQRTLLRMPPFLPFFFCAHSF